MENQYMLISFPGQGTDFFMDCLTSNNKELRYHREFFNPTCTVPIYKEKIKSAFGSEHNTKKIFFYNEELIDHIYKNTWVLSNFNVAKEVFSFSKIKFYNKHFKMFGLYRHRSSTFPTSRSRVVAPIFDSFIKENHLEIELHDEIRKYLTSLSVNDIQKQVLSHIFCWFIQFHEIQTNKIKVIKYYPLMNLPKEELGRYLKDHLPEELCLDNLCQNIIFKRNKEIQKKRNFDYKELNVEKVCMEFISFLEKLNTKLNDEYWEMLV